LFEDRLAGIPEGRFKPVRHADSSGGFWPGSIDWEYSAETEDPAVAGILDRYGVIVDGDGSVPKSKLYSPTINPATEERLADLPDAGEKDGDRAVQSARKGLAAWSSLDPRRRARILFDSSRLIAEKSRELAALISLDSGRPIRDLRSLEVCRSEASLFYNAGWVDKLDYVFPGQSYRPIGVVQISPSWRDPLSSAVSRLGPALACGNSVILTPHPLAPLASFHLAGLLAEAGIPSGVVNVVTGRDAALAIYKNPAVGARSFASRADYEAAQSSNPVGTIEAGQGGGTVSLVFDDAPIDEAVEGVVRAAFGSAPEGTWVMVQESIAEDFLRRIKRRMEGLRVGDPLDPNTEVGPLGSASLLSDVTDRLEGAAEEGCEVFQPAFGLPERGFYFRPALVSKAFPYLRVVQEGIPGPVALVMTFRVPEEGIELASGIRGTDCAQIWATKASRGIWAGQRLKSRKVLVNTSEGSDPSVGFGGPGPFGFGGQGGKRALASFLDFEEKTR